jgi:hypothetical protein
MITYRRLSGTPQAKSLSEFSVADFNVLCREWMHADSVARATAALTRGGVRTPTRGRQERRANGCSACPRACWPCWCRPCSVETGRC